VTLRQTLGGDARRIHELVDELLDGEDSLIVLIDGRRAISFAEGFGLSPCQLELVTIDIERAVRAVAGTTRRVRENLPLGTGCERARRASHANGPRRRSDARESVSGSPRGEAPRLGLEEDHASNEHKDRSGRLAARPVGRTFVAASANN